MEKSGFKPGLARYLKSAGIIILLLWVFTGFFGCQTARPVNMLFSAYVDGKPYQGPLTFTVENQQGQIGWGNYYADYSLDTLESVNRQYKGSRFGITTTYISGGPEGAVFTGLFYFVEYNDGSTQHFIDGNSVFESFNNLMITAEGATRTGCDYRYYHAGYGFIFRSPRTVNINTTLNGKTWSGLVNYTLDSFIGETIPLAHPFKPEKDLVHNYAVTKAVAGSSSPQVYDDITGDNITLTYISGGPPKARLDSISPSILELKAGESGTFILNFISDNETADLNITATLDEEPWLGNLNYAVTGPDALNGINVPQTHAVATGNYTARFISGGPAHARLKSITPSEKQEIFSAGPGTAFRNVYGFTFNFESSNNLTVQATLDGKPWPGSVGYSIIGRDSLTGNLAPSTFLRCAPVPTRLLTTAEGRPAQNLKTSRRRAAGN